MDVHVGQKMFLLSGGLSEALMPGAGLAAQEPQKIFGGHSKPLQSPPTTYKYLGDKSALTITFEASSKAKKKW